MIHKFTALLLIFIISQNSYARKWHTENIDNIFSISFPTKPIHRPTDNLGVVQYFCQQSGCLFSLSIKNGIIDDYYGYLLATDSDRESWANSILESIADSKIIQPFHYLISKQANRLGHSDFEMDILYETRQPSMQEDNKRFSKLLLLGNSLYVLEVWYMDNKIHDLAKAKFFKSVSLKKR
ncbi:hypothetical protein [Edaphocola flava]|uniref:hypothetical protein n=1 Tax=Edaphocola flava TaxID=2499629 RepID=UPI00100C1B77|nr:hypothetical protein [Edaphocola flava]